VGGGGGGGDTSPDCGRRNTVAFQGAVEVKAGLLDRGADHPSHKRLCRAVKLIQCLGGVGEILKDVR